MPVGIFDLFTLAVAIACYAIGRHRGLVWQLSGIATLLLGAICATILSRPLGGEGVVGRFAAWVVVYAVVAICLYVLTLKLRDRIKEMEFDELDKRFGGMLGAFKGLLAFAVVTLVAVGLSHTIERQVKASASGKGLREVVHALRPLMPERVHDAFGPWLDKVDGEPVEDAPVTTKVPEPPSEPVREPPPPPGRQPVPPPKEPQRPPPSLPDDGPLEYPEVERPRPSPRPEEPEEDDPFDTSEDPKDPLAPGD